MKSTMKSAFAFIAVALMIMVAVVPMVSVFTEENGVDAAVTSEYNNVLAEGKAITITGKIYNNRSDLANVPVTVEYDGVKVSAVTTTSGYSVKTTVSNEGGLIKEVKVTVDSTTAKVNGLTNGAYGMDFPVVTVCNVAKNTAVDVVADTALVSGSLMLKGADTVVYISDVSISGAVGAVTTKNGTFSFYGKIGSEYTLSASAVGTTFKADKFKLDNAGATIKLKAEKNIATITLTGAPMVPTFNAVAATGTNYNGIASLDSATLGQNGTTYYAYATINCNASVPTGYTFSSSTVFEVTYPGLTEAKSTNITLTASEDSTTKVISTTDQTASATPVGVASGDMKIGTLSVVPTSVILTGSYTDASGTKIEKTYTATIIGKTWYVQNFGGMTTAASPAQITLTSTKIVGTYAGYTFNEITGTSTVTTGTFTANNAVAVSGSVDKLPAGVYESAVTVTAQNYVADTDGLILRKAIASTQVGPSGTSESVTEKLTYSFYVPTNVSVTVNAPTEDYKPAKYVNDKVTKATTVPAFAYDSSVESTTYTGKITLNGKAIGGVDKLAYSIDGGKTFAAFTPEYVSGAYSLTVSSSIDPKDIFVKVAYDYTDGYAFEKTYMKAITSGNGYYYNFYGVTDTTIESIPVEADDVVVTIKDADSTVNVIAGQKVNFYMSTASDYAGLLADKYSVDLGSATTDAYGVATIEAAKVITSDSYNIFAVPEGDATLGAYVFASGAIAAMDGTTVISSTSKTTSGTVMDSYGAIVSEPKISYIEYSAADIVLGEGSAKVVDGKYYIVTGAAVDKVVIKIDGYNFNTATSKKITVGSTTTDITGVVANTPTVTKYSVTYDGNNSHVNVPVDSYKRGTVITFSADSEYTVEDTENIYSDGYTKYTFKAWYVNGKQVSTDAVTSYTVGDENVVVSADYTVEHVSVADGKDSDKGIDNNVLIIGIAAVIVALIAVVYAVVKKE